MELKLVYESPNFQVVAPAKPHVTRLDGGHIKVEPKQRVEKRQDLTPAQSIELEWITQLAGEAFTIAMNNSGIDIGRINYQDMGNWEVFKPGGPHLHVQIYGRAKGGKFQIYGDALNLPHRETGFYDNFEPINDEDIVEIRHQIELLLSMEKYQLENWHLA